MITKVSSKGQVVLTKALREMARIIKPGGRAIIVDLLPHDRDDFRRQLNHQHAGFGTETMGDMLREAGFGNPTVRPLPPQANTKGPALFLATGQRIQAIDS